MSDKQQKIEQAIGGSATQINKVVFIDKNYWLATNKGVFTLNKDYSLIAHYTLTEVGKQPLLARNIVLANETHIWVATAEGLKSINPFNEHLNRIYYSNISEHENNKNIYSLLIDNTKLLLIGSLNGLFIFKPYNEHNSTKSTFGSRKKYKYHLFYRK